MDDNTGQLDRRAAIAQARAIRREAAANAAADKVQAAEQAKEILAQAPPEPARNPRKPVPPTPVSGTTGRFRWLDEMRKPAVASASPDEIVEQLIAEAAERAKRTQKHESERKSKLADELVKQIMAASEPDALVAQVLAETVRHSSTKPVGETVAEPVAEPALPAARRSAGEETFSPKQPESRSRIPEPATEYRMVHGLAEEKASHAEQPPAEPAFAKKLRTEPPPELLAEAEREFAPETDAEEETDMPETLPEEPETEQETILPEEPEPTPEELPLPDDGEPELPEDLDDIPAGEPTDESPAGTEEPDAEPVLEEMPRYLRYPEPPESHAEDTAAYRAEVRAARKTVRRLVKKSEAEWQNAASSEQARLTIERTSRRAAILNIAACMVLIFGVTAGMFTFERPTVSMEENRNLATMPEFSVESYLSGEYTAGVAEYYNDTVPFRSTFKKWTQQLRTLLGISTSAAIHGGAPVVAEKQEEKPAETTAPEPAVTTAPEESDPDAPEVTTTAADSAHPTPAEPNADDQAQGEISGGILIYEKRGIMLYGGSFGVGEQYARYCSNFKRDLGENVNVYSMVIPTPCSFYTPEQYQNLIGSEWDNIEHINEHLEGVTPVDVYSALERHKDENIFMRTDHHWSSLGAFYGAEAFSAEARVPFARITDYDRQSQEGYVGTLYGYSNDIILRDNPEEFFWYLPRAEYTTTYWNRNLTSSYEGSFFLDISNWAPVSWYMVYMAGDDHMVQVQTGTKNGRRLCVIKDSYGNALIPWLTSSFEEIFVVDMRYFDVNAVRFMKERGVTDLLFAMNTFSANGPNCAGIEKIRTQ